MVRQQKSLLVNILVNPPRVTHRNVRVSVSKRPRISNPGDACLNKRATERPNLAHATHIDNNFPQNAFGSLKFALELANPQTLSFYSVLFTPFTGMLVPDDVFLDAVRFLARTDVDKYQLLSKRLRGFVDSHASLCPRHYLPVCLW